jgi:hypothetical protein
MPSSLRAVRPRRRRDGLQLPERQRAELAALARYVDLKAPNRSLQLLAYGAQVALRWATNNHDDMNPMRLLDLTAFGLRLERKTPLRLVPRLRPRRT